MRHLHEFVIENVDDIFEGAVIGNDQGHFFHKNKNGEYDYPLTVMNKLLQGEEIHTGKNGVGKILTIEDFHRDKLENLRDALSNNEINPAKTDGIAEFNNCLNDNGKAKFPKGVWGMIHKPDAKTNSNDGWSGEILTCCKYNDKDCDLVDIATKLEIHSIDSWVKSAELSADILEQHWSSSEYIAVQVSGEDRSSHSKKSDVIASYLKQADKLQCEKIALLYNDKTEAGKIVGLNLDDLYSRSKDAWNKADILLVNKNFDINEELLAKCKKQETNLDNGAPVSDSFTFNNLLISLCNNSRIIPVSLKKVVNKASLSKEGETHVDEESLKFIDDEIEIDCILPNLKDLKKSNTNTNDKNSSLQYNRLGSTYIGDKETKTVPSVQFRRRNTKNGTSDNLTNHGTLIVELMGKNAREGRGLENIKNILNIKSNDEYLNPFGFEETEDKFGNKLELSQSEIKKIETINDAVEEKTRKYYLSILDNEDKIMFKKYTSKTDDNYIMNWYKKPCFSGFMGLHMKWYDTKYSKDVKRENKETEYKSTLNAFYSFLVGCCKGLITGNNYLGQYWLVK